jgi:hypothetical protein
MVEIIEGCLTPLENWANVAVLEAWRRLAHWTELRSHLAVDSRRVALALAYRSLRRHIGPSPLMDVALVSAMLCTQYSSKDFVDEVMEVVRGTPGASLSGGRHSRAPESIYMSDEVVAVLLQEAL